jgi:hypothetical protein
MGRPIKSFDREANTSTPSDPKKISDNTFWKKKPSTLVEHQPALQRIHWLGMESGSRQGNWVARVEDCPLTWAGSSYHRWNHMEQSTAGACRRTGRMNTLRTRHSRSETDDARMVFSWFRKDLIIKTKHFFRIGGSNTFFWLQLKSSHILVV